MIQDRFLTLISNYSDEEQFNMNCWEEIVKCYSEASRYYHTLNHLEEMMAEFDEIASEIKKPDTLLFSLYYHDIIYKPIRKDNEQQSALLFRKRISKTSFPYINESMQQIELTKGHPTTSDFDTNAFLDMDLAILGKGEVPYREYAQNIRKEYRIFPDFIYNRERKKVLHRFLKKEKIYRTSHFISKYEASARSNIVQELALLV